MANVEMATLEKPPKVEETVFVAKTTRINRPKSGRVWKVPEDRKPVHTMKAMMKKKSAISWKRKMQDKLDLLAVKVSYKLNH